MARWSNNAYDLSIELENIIGTLNIFAYDLETSEDKKVPRDKIEALLFTTCNHLDRIAEDLKNIEQPQKLTETTTTIKTLYL